MLKLYLFIGFLLITPIDGKFRGGSKSSSSSSSNFRPQQNQGFAPQQSHGFQPHQQAPAPGWHPSVNQPNAGNRFGQPNQPGGFSGNRNFPGSQGGPSNFNSGRGMGSPSRGGAFKSALAGAAIGTVGGLLAFEAGKAIINSASSPFHYGSRDYYWGQEHYKNQNGQIMCSMPLEQLIAQSAPPSTTTTTTEAPGVTQDPMATTTTMNPNQVLQNLQFKDGSRPKQIVWGCKQGVEICCGTECCPAPVQNNPSPNSGSSTGSNIALIVLISLLVIGIICCCCCVLAYKLCRSAFDSCIPSSNDNDHSNQQQQYYQDGNKYEDNQQPYGQSYPMQPYPNQPYANQPYSNGPQPYPDAPAYSSGPPAPAYPSGTQAPYPSGTQAPYPSNQAPYPDQPHYGPPKY